MSGIGSGGKFIMAFIAVLIGVMLLATSATEVNNKTSKIGVANETIEIGAARVKDAGNCINETDTSKANFTLTNAPTDWRTGSDDCHISSFKLYIANGSAQATNAVDYRLDSKNGVVTLLNGTNNIWCGNATTNSNKTYANYAYCPKEYMDSSFGRSSLNIVPGMFAIALLLIGAGLFFSIAKDEGII